MRTMSEVQNSWEDLKGASCCAEFGLPLSTNYTHLCLFRPYLLPSMDNVQHHICTDFQLRNCSVFAELHDDIIHQACKIRTLRIATEALLLYYTPVPTSVLSEN